MIVENQHLLLGAILILLQSIQFMLHNAHSREIAQIKSDLAECKRALSEIRAINRKNPPH